MQMLCIMMVCVMVSEFQEPEHFLLWFVHAGFVAKLDQSNVISFCWQTRLIKRKTYDIICMCATF